MPIPGKIQTPPTRIFSESLPKHPQFQPPMTQTIVEGTTSATTPDPVVTVPWGDFRSESFSVPSFTAGQTQTVNHTFLLSSIPTISVLPARQLVIALSAGIYGMPNGLVIAGVQPNGQVTSNKLQFTGNTFKGGNTYSSFSAAVSYTLYAVNAVAASTPTAWCMVTLFNQPLTSSAI